MLLNRKLRMVDASSALPGRATTLPVPARHAVLDAPLQGPFPPGVQTAIFGMGCFWGAERIFWETAGVYTTAVGYAGGFTPNPTYEEVCSGSIDHAGDFYYAESYHQQYLAKNPGGYCGLGGTGVACPVGLTRPA